MPNRITRLIDIILHMDGDDRQESIPLTLRTELLIVALVLGIAGALAVCNA